MNVPTWVWIVTAIGLPALVLGDLLLADRGERRMTVARCTRRLAFAVGCAAVFAAGLWLLAGGQPAGQFAAGYLTEYSLSADNLFVFLVIIGRFAVPAVHEHRVLLVGLLIALAARSAVIAAGAAALAAFSAVFYLFGAFLLYTAVGTARAGHGAAVPAESDSEHGTRLLRLLRRVLPVTDRYHGSRMIAREGGRRRATPMLLAMAVIGGTDVLFALDSIPAVFGLTQDAYLVFATNAFALMGLRPLYFLLAGLLRRLAYLPYGLAILLGFIGVKLVLEALRQNSLPLINHGHGLDVPVPSTAFSLAFVAGVLVATTLLSLLRTRRHRRGSGVFKTPEPAPQVRDPS